MTERFWVWLMITVATLNGGVIAYNVTRGALGLAIFTVAWFSVVPQLARQARRPGSPPSRENM
jgi:hypothetical protein